MNTEKQQPWDVAADQLEELITSAFLRRAVGLEPPAGRMTAIVKSACESHATALTQENLELRDAMSKCRASKLFCDLEAATQENERLQADLNEAAKRNGEWIDKWGSCRVCGGEIPHGHSNNCDYYKIEQEAREWRARFNALDMELATARREIERLRTACQKAYALSMMRSEPYIPPGVREEIESTLQNALSLSQPNAVDAVKTNNKNSSNT